MSTQRYSVALFTLLILAFSACAAEKAKPATPQATEPFSIANFSGGDQALEKARKALADRLKQIESDPTISTDDLRTKINDTVAAARKQLENTDSWFSKTQNYKDEAATAPEKARNLRASAVPMRTIPEGKSLLEYEQMLSLAATDQNTADAAVRAFSERADRWSSRRMTMPKRLAALKEKIATLQSQFDTPTPDGEPPLLSEAKRGLNFASRLAVRAEIHAVDVEQATYDARGELLSASLDNAKRQAAAIAKHIDALQKRVNDERSKQAKLAVEQAEKATREAASIHPLVKQIAEENAEYAARATGSSGIVEKTVALTKRNQTCNAQIDTLTKSYDRVRDRVKNAGLTMGVEITLRREQAQLPNIVELRRFIALRQQEMSDIQTSLIDLDEARDKLSDLDAATADLINEVDNWTGEDQKKLATQRIHDLLAERLNVLMALHSYGSKYFNALSDLDATETELVDLAAEFSEYIRSNIFWFRSNEPFGRKDLSLAWNALKDNFLSLRAWQSVGRALLADFREQPHMFFGGFIAFLVMLLANRRIYRRIVRNGSLIDELHSSLRRVYLTIETLILTTVLALAWPALIAYFGWRIERADAYGEFSIAVGNGLIAAAAVFVTVHAFRAVCIHRGLAEVHFSWRVEGLRRLTQHLTYLTIFALPLVFLVVAADAMNDNSAIDALGRILFCILLAGFAYFIQRILKPTGGVIEAILPLDSDLRNTKRLSSAHFIGVAIPIGLMLISLAGYYYTAFQLSYRLIVTIWLVLVMLLIHSTLTRFVLFIRTPRVVRPPQQHDVCPDPATVTVDAVRVEPVEIAVNRLSIQARQLIRTCVLVGMLMGLWFTWRDVLPALGRLDQVRLWSVATVKTTTDAAATTTDAVSTPGATPLVSTGVKTIFKTDETGWITLADVCFASVLAAVFFVAARNIPKLIEILVLQQLPIDAGAKFAFTALIRYAITILGVILVFGRIGIGWDQVQWLVAAVTVGLGFGLQEIFSNFVSGLILLFERPVRVGDTVTIGDTSGEVTEIRIRSTRIRTADRKELIVPNREFITGRLMNWTLSDPSLRLVIPVNVVYGTDVELVCRTLLAVAIAEPSVLNQPEPSVQFVRFGPTAMEFELRVCIAHIREFSKTSHSLHIHIIEVFMDRGIDMPMPAGTVRPQRQTDPNAPIAPTPPK